MNSNGDNCHPRNARQLLAELKLDAEAESLAGDEKGNAFHEALLEQLKPQHTQSRRHKVLAAFQKKLTQCKDVKAVVNLLFEYGRPLGIENVRLHRLDRALKALTWVASAGLPPEYDEPRHPGVVKVCRFLLLPERDSLWSLHTGQPTCFRIDLTAPNELRAVPDQYGMLTVSLRKEQCRALKDVKGPVWVDFPFGFGQGSDEALVEGVSLANWRGKLSCNVAKDAPLAPDFRDRMMTFWSLVQAAALYLEVYSNGHWLGTSRSPAVEMMAAAVTEYEAIYATSDNAVISAWIAQVLRDEYAGKAAAMDGGWTNVCIADAIVHGVRDHQRSVGRLMTNSLEVPQRIPTGELFPLVDLTGGYVHRNANNSCVLTRADGVLDRIRRRGFSVCILGASGIEASRNPPQIYSYTGRTADIKQTFIDRSQDVIISLPSWKWGECHGDPYIDLSRRHPSVQNLHLVTVFPHCNEEDPGKVQWQAGKLQEEFDKGVRGLESLPFNARFNYLVARFDPLRPYPAFQRVSQETLAKFSPGNAVDARRAVRTSDLYREVNPNGHPDIRLLVCIRLAFQERKPDCDSAPEWDELIPELSFDGD